MVSRYEDHNPYHLTQDFMECKKMCFFLCSFWCVVVKWVSQIENLEKLLPEQNHRRQWEIHLQNQGGKTSWLPWLNMITGWWFQPLWRIFRQFGSFPQVGMKIKNIWNHRSCRSHRVGAVTRRQSIVSLVLWALQSRTWWYLGVFFFGWGGGYAHDSGQHMTIQDFFCGRWLLTKIKWEKLHPEKL